jgi:CRISPR-associated protein Csd1
LKKDGTLRKAEVKTERIIAPCTESSEGRSGKNPVAHPLFDKLQYLAGDYSIYVKPGSRHFYENYMQELRKWAVFANGNEMLDAILRYLEQGRLIKDLIEARVLPEDVNGRLKESGTSEEEKKEWPIFKLENCKPSNAVVRFEVKTGRGIQGNAVWRDKGVRDSFIAYMQSKQNNEEDLCYVSGERTAIGKNHPKKIVAGAAQAKLISANDKTGFTFRGRFRNSAEATGVGFEVSQKAHNALRWLIETRRKQNGSQVIVAWGEKGSEAPDPTADSETLHAAYGTGDRVETDNDRVQKAKTDTDISFSERLNAALDSVWLGKISSNMPVTVMALDNATPGRLSIVYYREMEPKEYLECVSKWHQTCTWQHSYKWSKDKKRIIFYGAPSTKDIVSAAYGRNANEKFVNGMMRHLLTCIFDGAELRPDLVDALIRRASNPLAAERAEWEKILSIACALYRKQLLDKKERFGVRRQIRKEAMYMDAAQNEKEKLNLAVDEERTDRDYLYGRLLAIADMIEFTIIRKNKEDRSTNAMRYMNAFSKRPFYVWRIIHEQMQPYKERLKIGSRIYFDQLLTNIESKFKDGDYEDDRPLNGSYLHGYYRQRHDLFQKKPENAKNEQSDGGEQNDFTE